MSAELKPESRPALAYGGRMTALTGVLAFFLGAIGVSIHVHLDLPRIVLIGVGVTTLLLLSPLYIFFTRRELAKRWFLSEIGINIRRAGRTDVLVGWDKLREVFVKRYSVTMFRHDGEHETIFFLSPAAQDQFIRYWHKYRTDHPERKLSAPEDNRLEV